LGRVSNLPTVWSNCLAGWWLSGGGNFWKLPFLLVGMSALYTGGMFLNDAFDADFDRQRRAARPIPSGLISLKTVWRAGWALLALGILCLLFLGKIASVLAIVLAICILIYNLGLRHRGNDRRLGIERLADWLRRGIGVLCRRTKLCGQAGKFSRADSPLAIAVTGHAHHSCLINEQRFGTDACPVCFFNPGDVGGLVRADDFFGGRN
jgi:hypothetical protein